MTNDPGRAAFPTVTPGELAFLRPLAEALRRPDGAAVFRAGDAGLDLFVVEEGAVAITTRPTATPRSPPRP